MRALADVGPIDVGHADGHHQIVGNAEGAADRSAADGADAVDMLMLACGRGQGEVVELAKPDELIDDEGGDLALSEGCGGDGDNRPEPHVPRVGGTSGPVRRRCEISSEEKTVASIHWQRRLGSCHARRS